jgi:hypothetical protein
LTCLAVDDRAIYAGSVDRSVYVYAVEPPYTQLHVLTRALLPVRDVDVSRVGHLVAVANEYLTY